MLLVLRAPLRVEVEGRRARPPLLAVGCDVDVDDSTRPRDRADRCDEERMQRTALAIGLGRVSLATFTPLKPIVMMSTALALMMASRSRVWKFG